MGSGFPPRRRGQAMTEFALVGPLVILLGVGLGLGVLFALDTVQTTTALVLGAREAAWAPVPDPKAVAARLDPVFREGFTFTRDRSSRTVRASLRVSRAGPTVMGVVFHEVQSGDVAARWWYFFGGPP